MRRETEIEEVPLLEFGFTKNPMGYSIDIKVDDYNFKQLCVSYNNDNSSNQYYAFFRDGDPKKNRCSDDVVCLRKDLMYMSQLDIIYFALTDKHLTRK